MVPAVTKSLLRRLAVNTVWFLIVFFVIYSIIWVALSGANAFDMANPVTSWTLALIASNAIFLLVLGIIYPLLLAHYVAQGVTRREFALALMASALSIALFFAIFNVVFLALLYPEVLPHAPSAAILPFASFLLGWVCVIGFQFSRWFLAAASIIIGEALAQLLSTSYEPLFSQGWYLFPALLLAITLATAFTLLLLTLRIPLKCT
jgi:hypothetical protein